MYDINFIVKYKTIEEELLQKIEEGEKDYTKEDVLLIVENLYQHEILCVLQINDNDTSFGTITAEILPKMKENLAFQEVLHNYKSKLPLVFGDNDDLCFAGMFCYNLFHVLHQCICQQLLTNKIDERVIDLFNKQIQEI